MKTPKRNIPEGTGRSHRRRLRSILLILSVVVVLVLLGSGIFYYRTYIAPFQKAVITVDNQVIRMDYFLKRTKMAGNDPTITLQQLTYEEIVKIMAPQYGFIVSPSDIDGELRKKAASSVTDNITEATFQEWYTGQLKATGLTDSEYRDIVKASLLADKFREYLANNVPTSAEQVHLYTIVLATSTDAANARARITGGETFATVAGQLSLDVQTRSNGGDLGWIPKGVIPYDDTIFQLLTGQVSDPVKF